MFFALTSFSRQQIMAVLFGGRLRNRDPETNSGPCHQNLLLETATQQKITLSAKRKARVAQKAPR